MPTARRNKQAPTPKKAPESPVKELSSKAPDPLPDLQTLARAVEKLATLTGNGNILQEFGLKMWQPRPEDTRKYRTLS